MSCGLASDVMFGVVLSCLLPVALLLMACLVLLFLASGPAANSDGHARRVVSLTNLAEQFAEVDLAVANAMGEPCNG